MIKFDPEARIYGDIYDAAVKVKSVKEAQQYLKDYAEAISKSSGKTPKEALACARSNIGYLLGYGASRAVLKIWSEARTAHPIFGELTDLDKIDPKEAFEKGRKMGRKA